MYLHVIEIKILQLLGDVNTINAEGTYMSKFDDKITELNTYVFEMAYGYGPDSQKITYEGLINTLKEVSESDKNIKFTSITVAPINKKSISEDKNIAQIYKVSQVSAKINVDYGSKRTEVGVLSGEIKRGDKYELKKSYGTHVTSSVIEHSGKLYLQVMPESALSPVYVIQDNIGRFTTTTKDEIMPYLKESPKPSTSSADKVPIRRYQLASIVAVEIDNVDYQITDVDKDRLAILSLVGKI